MSKNKDQVRIFYEQIWNRHDKGVIPKILDKEFTFRGSLGEYKKGHEGFTEYLDQIHTALGEYRCDIEELVSEGDRVFAKMRFSGVHQGALLGFKPTGQAVSWQGAALFTFSDGKIADLWVLGDVQSLERQLGDI